MVSDEKSVDIAFDDSEEEEEEEVAERGSTSRSAAHWPSGVRAGSSHGRGERSRRVTPGGSGRGGDMEDEGFCILDSPTSTIVVCLFVCLFICFVTCNVHMYTHYLLPMCMCVPLLMNMYELLLHSLGPGSWGPASH